MLRVTVRALPAAVLLLAGCLTPVGESIDATVCDLSMPPRDLQPASHAGPRPTLAPSTPDRDDKKGQRLTVPDDLLPGGPVSPIKLPPAKEGDDKARQAALEKLYPPQAPVGHDHPAPPGPEGRPFTLADLHRLALANSPAIRQAAARVEEARGAAIQAGLPPNPTVGYEGDTIATNAGPGYQGGFVEMALKTGNKLQLARAAAVMDLHNAELALKAAQAELATKVRGGYFAILVAEEAVRLNRSLVEFTEKAYRAQVDQVRRGGFAAPYEPMYLRALATQARAGLIQARNRRTSAWKQLAANLGLPGLAPVELAGRLDVAIPIFQYQEVLAKALTNHTDVRTAENSLQQARYRLELARITPLPDVNLRVMLQKDRTAPPFNLSPSVAVSVPVPVFDRNQGGIHQAEAALVTASEEAHRARANLTRRLAEAFEEYENTSVVLGYYRDRILPDLVRVYRGVYERYQTELPGPGASPPTLNDVVVAQQNLAQAVATYLTTLGTQWQSAVAVADLLQTPDLFGVSGAEGGGPALCDLAKLLALPCCHPCSPLPGAHQAIDLSGWLPSVGFPTQSPQSGNKGASSADKDGERPARFTPPAGGAHPRPAP